MTKRKTIIGVLIALVIALLVIAGSKVSAGATEGDDCVPSDAVPAQHYSWTGGNLPTDTPPTEVPPSDNWQANTSQEPHTNGVGNPATWVNANLHYTAASEQHASWFYFTPEIPAVECPPDDVEVAPSYSAEQFCPPQGLEIRIEGQLVGLGSGETATYTYEVTQGAPQTIVFEFWPKDGYVFVDGTTSFSDVVFVAAPEGCDDPEQPDPLIQQTSSTDYNCGDTHQTVVTYTTTTEYVWDEELQEWVLGEPVTGWEVVTSPVDEVVPCDRPDEPKDEPKTPTLTKKTPVPTAVDAGL